MNDASRSVSQSLGRGGGDGLVIFLANRIPEVPGPSIPLSVLWGSIIWKFSVSFGFWYSWLGMRRVSYLQHRGRIQKLSYSY